MTWNTLLSKNSRSSRSTSADNAMTTIFTDRQTQSQKWVRPVTILWRMNSVQKYITVHSDIVNMMNQE